MTIRTFVALVALLGGLGSGCTGEVGGREGRPSADAGELLRDDAGLDARDDGGSDSIPDGPYVSGLVLFDESSGEVLAEVAHGARVEIASLACRCVRVRAVVGDEPVGSVRLELGGASTLDSEAPYELEEGSCIGVGDHEVLATAYELVDGGGIAGAPRSIAFQLVSADALPPTTIPAGVVPEPWDLAAICGTTHTVSTLAELETALAEVEPGDGIRITAGTYDWGDVVIPDHVRGTAERPIVIRSHEGPVIFTGATTLRVAGSHVHFQGLSWDGGSGGLRVAGTSSQPPTGVRFSLVHCRALTALCFYTGVSTRTRFDHSLIEESLTKSIHVGNQSTLTRIDHNHLRDLETHVVDGTVVNGGEAIQLGHGMPGAVGEMAIIPLRALVDHNVLQRAEREGEMIGIKTAGNVVAFNVIVDATYGHLSFRGGEHNLALGNVMRNTRGGVRVHGIAPVVVHNLIVDPHAWEGIRIPTGSDRLWQPDGYDETYVRYVAARDGRFGNNTVVLTPRGATNTNAFAMNAQRDYCGGPCDLEPFDNAFVRNMFVNVRGGSTVGYPQTFVDGNSFEDNAYWLADGATLGVEGAVADSLAPTSEALHAPHAALADFVWDAPAGECLRLERASELDEAQGVVFSLGRCERPGEDAGALLGGIDLLNDPSAAERLASWLAEQPPMIVPNIPPSR